MSNDRTENPLPPDLDARVQSELRPAERLMWAGQPRPGRYTRQSLPFMLIGVPFTAFALFWMAGAGVMAFLAGNAAGDGGIFSLCFPLFGIPFVLVGLGMLSTPFWFARKAKRTCYAITDRRAILWEAGWWGRLDVRSYEPSALNRMVRTEYADGCGDLVFEEVVSHGRDDDGNRTTYTTRHGFLAIDGVRAVEDLLRKTLLPNAPKRTRG